MADKLNVGIIGLGGIANLHHEGWDLVENAKTALLSAKIMGGNCIKNFEPLEE